MATITLQYDARNIAIRDMIAALLKFDGISEIVPKNEKLDPEVDEIAKSYIGVKKGKIKTRPVSELLEEI